MKTVILRFISGGILLIIWHISAQFIPPYVLPSPITVAQAGILDMPYLLKNTAITLFEAMSGFIIAILIGFAFAVAMHEWRRLKIIIYPVLVFSQAVPILALAPLFVIWFGFGYLPKIITVVLICFFPITVNLTEGLGSADKPLLNVMRTMGANRWQILRHVQIPSALGHLFSGIKTSAAYSIMGAVIGEWLGGYGGLGVYMIRVQKAYALDKMFAAIAMIVIVTMLLFFVISSIQRLLLPWSTINKEEL